MATLRITASWNCALHETTASTSRRRPTRPARRAPGPWRVVADTVSWYDRARVSSTPAQKFVCPRCRTSFAEPSHFCRECGADMTRASALERPRSRSRRRHRVERSGASADRADRRLSDSNQAWLGKIVDGRYRVLEVIGRGGMGVVYRVEHLRMGKIAAMKVLHRDLASDPEVVQRFEREAAAVSKLHHPHTVQVFDFGTAHGALYLIMELCAASISRASIERDGPMPWARAAPLLAQICGALQEAHELGIVHRDLKPENVLITRTAGGRDYAKVLDFGLAKLDAARRADDDDRSRSRSSARRTSWRPSRSAATRSTRAATSTRSAR